MQEKNQENPLTEHIRKLGRLKREVKALSGGRYKELLLTNRQYAFARMLEGETLITAVNNDENPAELSIPVPVQGTRAVDLLTDQEVPMENGRLNVKLLPGGSACVQIFA